MDCIAPGTWRDDRALAVLGTGQALPGQPIATRELLDCIAARFEVNVVRRGLAAARRLNIRQRHLARSFERRVEGTRPGDGNPDLAARAVHAALAEAGLRPNDLAYLIGHTVTPAEPVPSNISAVARLLRYRGPVAEFRQACTGFINATLFAAGLCAVSDGRPVAVVGSETGSVFFDPVRAAEDDSQLVNFMQMGDGAGAIILGSEQSHTRTARICRLYGGELLPEGELVACDAELFQGVGVVARRDPLFVRFRFRRHVRRALHLPPQFFALTLRSYPYSRIEPQCFVEESYQHAWMLSTP